MKLMLLLACVLMMTGCASHNISYQGMMRSTYVKTHKRLPQEAKDAILAGTPINGMSRYEVELCKGQPDKKRRAGAEEGKSEMWIYEKTHSGGATTLYDISIVTDRMTFTNSSEGLVLSAWKAYE